MTNPECLQLDDFLDGVLPVERIAAFEQHVQLCPACRQAAQFEKAFTAAAQRSSDAVIVPAFVANRTQQAIRRWERNRRIAWAAGIAAALLLVCGLSYAMLAGTDNSRLAEVDRKNDAPAVAIKQMEVPQERSSMPSILGDNREVPQPTLVRLRSTDSPRQVAVSIPTENKDVTMVMLFPTIPRTVSN